MSAGLTIWLASTIICAVMTFGGVQNEKPVELPEGAGKKLLETACSACHGLNEISRNEGLPRDSWQKLVHHTGLNEEQINTLVNYLAINFGEGRKILDTACTTCHSLDEVKKFRGFFRRDDWQDIVTTMVKYGADVKETQVPALVEYLTAAYGK